MYWNSGMSEQRPVLLGQQVPGAGLKEARNLFLWPAPWFLEQWLDSALCLLLHILPHLMRVTWLPRLPVSSTIILLSHWAVMRNFCSLMNVFWAPTLPGTVLCSWGVSANKSIPTYWLERCLSVKCLSPEHKELSSNSQKPHLKKKTQQLAL